jgi:hypothetical protein
VLLAFPSEGEDVEVERVVFLHVFGRSRRIPIEVLMLRVTKVSSVHRRGKGTGERL